MLDRMGRDEMHYKIAHLDGGMHSRKDEVLEEMKSITDPNFKDNAGVSYLHMACQAHSVEAINILLEKGADPNIRDNNGRYAVTVALGRKNENNEKILEILLQNGLKLDAPTRDGGTLRGAIERFGDDRLNKLLEKW